MHFEILVEDASGKIMLESIVPKILGQNTTHTFRIHSYKGVGRLPKNLKSASAPRKRILLDNIPRLLRGYGKSLQPRENNAVIVVVDSDRKNCIEFKNELMNVLEKCHPAPRTLFRIAVEEMEAWFMGDAAAVMSAYPNAKKYILNNYDQDSVCGTWEVLADALYRGGSAALKNRGFPYTGQEKCRWAEKIAPQMNIAANSSPSFRVFKESFNKLNQGVV